MKDANGREIKDGDQVLCLESGEIRHVVQETDRTTGMGYLAVQVRKHQLPGEYCKWVLNRRRAKSCIVVDAGAWSR